ncbi:MAG: hypothetical protein ACQES4_11475 [Bacillota bacterium]
MSVNFDPVMPNAAYLRDIYFGQNENENISNRSESARQESENRSSGIMNQQDTVTISAEARNMQRLSGMNNIDDTTLGQQREMYRPGLEQTEIRSEAGIEEPREANNEVIRGSEMPVKEQEELVSLKEQEGMREAPARFEKNEQQPLREEESFGEAQQRARSSEDMRTVEANINSFNSSSLVQAYATAANVTQASFTVNYKV